MISQKELTELAALARLALPEAERTTLAHDLEQILGYVDQLKKVELSEKVRPCISALRSNLKESNGVNIWREDQDPHPSEASRQFKVKAVF